MRWTTEYFRNILRSTCQYIEQANERARAKKEQEFRQQAENLRQKREFEYSQSLRKICSEALNRANSTKYGLAVPYSSEALLLKLENTQDGENWKLGFPVNRNLSRVMLKNFVADINLIFQHLFCDLVSEFQEEIAYIGNIIAEHNVYDPMGDNSYVLALHRSYANLYREKGRYLLLIRPSDAVQVSADRIVLNFSVCNDLTAEYDPSRLSFLVDRYLRG